MRMKTTINTDQLEMDFYFWLGGDGEAEPVSEEEFLDRQLTLRKNLDDFLNVRILDEDADPE